jgi:hypothetical protein
MDESVMGKLSPFMEALRLTSVVTFWLESFGEFVAFNVDIRGLPSSNRRCRLFLFLWGLCVNIFGVEILSNF